MSYEYNASSQRFELDNPYRVENLGLFICFVLGFGAGIVLIVNARMAMAVSDWHSARKLVVGVALVVVGLGCLGWMLMQLRFLFGRGLPLGLSPELRPTDAARPKQAEYLKEILRHNDLSFVEPKGPVSGLVHWLLKDLIFAPTPIRRAAEVQCENALFTAALLLSFLATLAAYREAQPEIWTAIAFVLLLAPRLIKPLRSNSQATAKAPTGMQSILLIILLPMFVPIIVGNVATQLPDLSGASVVGSTVASLVMLLAGQVAFCLALKRQLGPKPDANTACEQRALSMNGNPAKLFEELERELQRRWTNTVPNRRYSHAPLPSVYSGQSNSFDGELLQETQPLPQVDTPKEDLLTALQDGRRKSLVMLSALGVIAFAAFVAAAVAEATLDFKDARWLTYFFMSSVFLLTANYCFRSAHFLWGRFDFASLLVWIDLRGSVEEARVGFGNQFRDSLQTEKKIVNVEGMTVSVWVAELTTVVFGKEGERAIVAVRGRKDLADSYADHISTYARNLSSVVAPSSETDTQRMAAMAAANLRLDTAAGNAVPPIVREISNAAGVMLRHCRNDACSRPMPTEAAFCSACGTAVTA